MLKAPTSVDPSAIMMPKRPALASTCSPPANPSLPGTRRRPEAIPYAGATPSRSGRARSMHDAKGSFVVTPLLEDAFQASSTGFPPYVEKPGEQGEKEMEALCKRARLSRKQVVDWFYRKRIKLGTQTLKRHRIEYLRTQAVQAPAHQHSLSKATSASKNGMSTEEDSSELSDVELRSTSNVSSDAEVPLAQTDPHNQRRYPYLPPTSHGPSKLTVRPVHRKRAPSSVPTSPPKGRKRFRDALAQDPNATTVRLKLTPFQAQNARPSDEPTSSDLPEASHPPPFRHHRKPLGKGPRIWYTSRPPPAPELVASEAEYRNDAYSAAPSAAFRGDSDLATPLLQNSYMPLGRWSHRSIYDQQPESCPPTSTRFTTSGSLSSRLAFLSTSFSAQDMQVEGTSKTQWRGANQDLTQLVPPTYGAEGNQCLPNAGRWWPSGPSSPPSTIAPSHLQSTSAYPRPFVHASDPSCSAPTFSPTASGTSHLSLLPSISQHQAATHAAGDEQSRAAFAAVQTLLSRPIVTADVLSQLGLELRPAPAASVNLGQSPELSAAVPEPVGGGFIDHSVDIGDLGSGFRSAAHQQQWNPPTPFESHAISDPFSYSFNGNHHQDDWIQGAPSSHQ